MMLIMTKTARNSRTTSVMWFLVGPVGCTVARTVVGDAEKRVRVKPLSRPETRQMPPHPPDSVPLLCRQLAPITWRPL